MLVSFFMQLIALWFLSMAMSKHFRSVFKRPLEDNKAKAFKVLGWILLLLSYVIIVNKNTAMSSVYWCSYLALNIFIIALFNTFSTLKQKN
ncbi:hypothetical protein CJF42_05645 [Pseudoalteromonas sp. NBT06-2]|uniref:DUF3325 domain-containing protein n=1 Tax=Pseudoalteromonas sp. NBT06-2 TaxID=2025950 RepID=UPI000BA707D9|nr:DUF3325 domain-containing protein [Pseudoalteromonas sp. NBT06-2]PAJ75328.1 hypothetical protein CJF42_05645 [Pseudoalteromonas sp. NBT06-2]